MTVKIERVDRTIIENKLLIALNDSDKVAIVATKRDLDLLIWALGNADEDYPRPEIGEMYRDMVKLKKAAFGG